jgi:hypothetical protein
MSFDFDLNIYNYNTDELETFLGLDEDYTLNDIKNKHDIIYNAISQSNDYDNEKKIQIHDFLNSARNKLVRDMSKDNGGFVEDYDKLLVSSEENNVVNQTTAIYAGNNFTINKETTSFNKSINKNEYLNPVETYPTNVSRSLLNNLKRKTITQTLILNSLYREDHANTTSSDFSIILPQTFKNVLSLRLSSVHLPELIYNITSENDSNVFYIHEANITGTDSSFVQIMIPEGIYNIAEYSLVLKLVINTTMDVFDSSKNRYDVSVNNYTQQMTISNKYNNFNLYFLKDPLFGKYVHDDRNKELHDKITQTIYKKIGWTMGFRKSSYLDKKTYTTEGMFNANSSEYLYFILNDFNNSQSQNIIGMFSKSMISNNILAVIPISKNNTTNIYTDKCSDFIEKKREYFGPVKIQKLKIQLLNQYGDLFDLNNMDFSFSVDLEMGYDW